MRIRIVQTNPLTGFHQGRATGDSQMSSPRCRRLLGVVGEARPVVLELEGIDRMYLNVHARFASGGMGSEVHPHPPRASGGLDSNG